MRLILYFFIFISIANSKESIRYKPGLNIEGNSIYGQGNVPISPREYNKPPVQKDNDVKHALKGANVLKKARELEKRLNEDERGLAPTFRGVLQKSRFHKDPVLNVMRRRYSSKESSKDSSSSSSMDMEDWKDEFRQKWLGKKVHALNESRPRGDVVNMVAARPWGVQCGDPNQHDLPWGTCTLAMECESEYRIYRGDYFCGRTEFVCCAIKTNTYDMYMGIDISLDDSSFEDSHSDSNTKERKRRDRRKEKKKRIKNRKRRKTKMKDTIRKIKRQVNKMLQRTYRNGTKARKRRTKQLKKFLKELKNRYKKDRQSIRDIHDVDMIKIDAVLMAKLKTIAAMNKEFASNDAYRQWITNGTMTKEQAKWLATAFPDLSSFLVKRRSGRRPDYLDYDIEYGFVYY